MELSVIKRDGTRTAFNPMKIEQAISKAVKSTTGTEHPELTLDVTRDVCKKVYDRDTNTISVEDIQDLVENQLIEYNEAAIAKKYILYRQKRSEIREMNSSIFQAISQYIAVTPTALDDDKRENANINADSTSGAMLKIGSTANKTYSLCKLISPKYAQMHREGKIHVHDLDYLNLTVNCISANTNIVLKDEHGNLISTTANFFDQHYKDDKLLNIYGWSILSMDGEFTPLVHSFRRKEEKEIIHIFVEGTDLYLTDEHIIPIYRNGQYLEVYAKDLLTTDKLIYCPSIVNSRENVIDALNLIDFLENSTEKIILDKPSSNAFRWALHDTYSIQKFYKETSVGYLNPITLPIYRKYRDITKLDESNIGIRVLRGHKSYNAILPLTYELGWLCGIFYTEGSVTRNEGSDGASLAFTNSDPEILDKILKYIDTVFENQHLTKSVNASGCTIFTTGSRLLFNLFKHHLCIKEDSGNMEIPEWYFNANKDFLRGFISGVIDGDGGMNTSAVYISLSAKKFIVQLRNLLRIFGIGSLYRETLAKGTIARFGDIESVRRYDYYTLQFPSYLLEKDFADNLLYQRKLQKYGLSTTRLSMSNIRKIKRESYSGYVYDFETGNHYFSADGIIVHNCIYLPADQLLKNGFGTGHGSLRPPTTIGTAATQIAIMIQSDQNDCFNK